MSPTPFGPEKPQKDERICELARFVMGQAERVEVDHAVQRAVIRKTRRGARQSAALLVHPPVFCIARSVVQRGGPEAVKFGPAAQKSVLCAEVFGPGSVSF